MRRGLILLFLALIGLAKGQSAYPAMTSLSLDTVLSPVFPIPTKEEFINQVLPFLVDSTFTYYYLGTTADSCVFVKYDYDEWAKYGLDEPVSIVTLNELSEKCYRDSMSSEWQQDKLVRAFCVDLCMTEAILDPFYGLEGKERRQLTKKVIRRQRKEWEARPPQERIIYWFSKPEFTDDGQYAVMNVLNDCGSECATWLVYLFRHEARGWKRIGRMVYMQS